MIENKLKELEGNLNTEDNIQSYNIYKKELDAISDHIAKVIGFDQNVTDMNTVLLSTKFFLNLERKHGNLNQNRQLSLDKKEINGDVEVLKNRKFL